MFTSKEYLHSKLGLDARIAEFFVNRKVPLNNNYWKNRLLYVSKGKGYLFIPVFFDLQYKCDATFELVTNEEYVQVMEAILDSAAVHEFEEISFQQHIENCKNIMHGKVKNYSLYDDLLVYFSNESLKPYKNFGTASKALNRGDTFLFSLCFLELDKKIADRIIHAWYALVPSFLLMDDIYDLHEDIENHQENAVLDFGTLPTGFVKAIQLLRYNFQRLKSLNDKLGSYFEKSLESRLQTPYMQALLNKNQHGY